MRPKRDLVDFLEEKRSTLGYTDKQFAEFLGVGVEVWNRTHKRHIPVGRKMLSAALYRFPSLQKCKFDAELVIDYLMAMAMRDLGFPESGPRLNSVTGTETEVGVDNKEAKAWARIEASN